MNRFKIQIRAIMSLILAAFLLVGCASVGSYMPNLGKDETAGPTTRSVVLMPVTGLSDSENNNFFIAFQTRASQKNIAVLKEQSTPAEKVASIIQGYLLNDADAKTISIVFDMLAPDNNRQQRFSQTISYSELKMSGGSQSGIPLQALDALAAIALEKIASGLNL